MPKVLLFRERERERFKAGKNGKWKPHGSLEQGGKDEQQRLNTILYTHGQEGNDITRERESKASQATPTQPNVRGNKTFKTYRPGATDIPKRTSSQPTELYRANDRQT